MMILRRASGWTDRFRSYQVLLNDKAIGKINNGEEKSFEIQEGNHKLKIVIDWCSSQSLDFHNDNSTPLNFECGSSLRGLKIFSGLHYVLNRTDEYLWLCQRAE
ncbi:hypothetical protein [Marinicella meishanensis]|uniref:hypothetical protein n=1 Tax=Marinicella meishanensis TaxID=2873263 RepID=UPI001CBF5E39|nr:hypothetical protein [Marinicella sp. NBU2979]